MRFMLLQNYGEVASGAPPITEWSPGDIKTHIEFQGTLNDELVASGELVDAQGLAGPDQAKFVVSDGKSAPVITDGPFPESKELLAGYRLIDVESLERAIEIAAKGLGRSRLQRRADPRRHRGPPGHERAGPRGVTSEAVQEALLAAATAWPTEGPPDSPLAWLVQVASRRMVDELRRNDARRRREDMAASCSLARPDPAPGRDDTLIVMFMCCHPSPTPASAIPLTLRAVGGLTTREIAAAFLVPEATMAQRISRAKAELRETDEPFDLPSPQARPERLRLVLHVLYLLFNEGYASSSGPDLARTDLSGEAIRLGRRIHAALPDDPRWRACSPSCSSPTPGGRRAPTPTASSCPSPTRTVPAGTAS